MDNRAEIERLIMDAYAARRRGDIAAMGHIFTPDVRFKLAGSAKESAVAMEAAGMDSFKVAVAGMIKTFDWLDVTVLAMVIEEGRAAVHWRGRLRSTVTGDTVETELMDLFELRDGRICSLIEFCDTALAGRMMGSMLR